MRMQSLQSHPSTALDQASLRDQVVSTDYSFSEVLAEHGVAAGWSSGCWQSSTHTLMIQLKHSVQVSHTI